MKILHLSDIHYKLAWLTWASEQARNYDLIVLAGDLLDTYSEVSLSDQSRTVRRWLLSLPTPAVVCSGNHDYRESDPRDPDDTQADAGWIKGLRGKGLIIGVDGDAIDFKGLKMFINGWRQKPHAGPFDIVVTHAPPYASPCAYSDGSDYGDMYLWDALIPRLPSLLLCGHVHQPARLSFQSPTLPVSCAVLVPGRENRGTTPSHWAINTDRRVAIHSGGTIQSFDL